MLFTNAESERHGGVARLHHHLRMLVLEVLGDQLKPEIKTVLHNILEKLQIKFKGAIKSTTKQGKNGEKKPTHQVELDLLLAGDVRAVDGSEAASEVVLVGLEQLAAASVVVATATALRSTGLQS